MIRRRNILFAYDRSGESHRLYTYLKKRGLSPQLVEGGTAEIIYQTSIKHPDLLILYDSPPEIEPREVCKILKGQIDTQSILILVLNGKEEKDEKLAAFGLAADAYVSRLLPVEELYAKIYSLLTVRELQLQLLESEKFAALGRLADRIAHEFRNPLTVIGGFAHRIKKKHPNDPICQDYVARILKEVTRLERIIDQVTEFEAPSKGKPEYIDLIILLQEIAEELHRRPSTSSKKVEIVIPENDRIPLVYANRLGLKNIFTHLLENALDAIPEAKKGRIEIQTGLDTEEGILWIKIKDNGIGIPPDVLNKVMDPFFTTKPYRIGLGLTLVYQLVRDTQGRIEVESEEGRGTTVTILLPLILKAPLPRPTSP